MDSLEEEDTTLSKSSSTHKNMNEKKGYEQAFRKKWLEDPLFKDWLMPDEQNKFSASCKFCKKKFARATKSVLNRHQASFKHKLNHTVQGIVANEVDEELTPDNCEISVEECQGKAEPSGAPSTKRKQSLPTRKLGEFETLSKSWALELKYITPEQCIYAKKAIHDILYEAHLGTLHRNSVKINDEESIILA